MRIRLLIHHQNRSVGSGLVYGKPSDSVAIQSGSCSRKPGSMHIAIELTIAENNTSTWFVATRLGSRYIGTCAGKSHHNTTGNQVPTGRFEACAGSSRQINL